MYANTDSIKEVAHARSMVRWMGLGVMPSTQNVEKAKLAIQDQIKSGVADPSDLKQAMRVTNAMLQGIAPSQENCKAAAIDLSQLIERLRESSANTVRDRATGG